MSKAISPHQSSCKDVNYCLSDDDFTSDGLHRVLSRHLAKELSDEFESAVHRRFKHKRWNVSNTGKSPFRGTIPMIEIRPKANTSVASPENESFVLDFDIVPVSDVGKKKNNSPVVHCKILRYVDKEYAGVIHESYRSGAGTYNPDQWAYLAYLVVRTWIEQSAGKQTILNR